MRWLSGGLLLMAMGCDNTPEVEIPEDPTEMPAEPPASSLPPPPPPQY